jgi:hypothetical protein
MASRCVAIEKKYWYSASRCRTFTSPQREPPPAGTLSPTPFAFSRLFEASDILSSIQKAVFEQRAGGPFNLRDVPHPAKVLEAFRDTLAVEVPPELKVYSSSWAVFNT